MQTNKNIPGDVPEYAPLGSETAAPGREDTSPGPEQQPEQPAALAETPARARQKRLRARRDRLLRTLLLAAAALAVTTAAVSDPALQWNDPDPAVPAQTEAPAPAPTAAAPVPTAAPQPTATLTPAPTPTPTATPTPTPRRDNYFDRNGITVLENPPKEELPVTFVTYQKEDLTVYRSWDSGKLLSCVQTVSRAQREGYKTVKLTMDVDLTFGHDPSTDTASNWVWRSSMYDLYTGRRLPRKSIYGDTAYDAEYTLEIDGEPREIYYSCDTRWFNSGWIDTGTEEHLTARNHMTMTFEVPEEYDGLVFCLVPAYKPGDDFEGDEGDVDYSESYYLDEHTLDDAAESVFFRFGQKNPAAG